MMNQKRVSNLTVLNTHKERNDRLSTTDSTNEFSTATQTEGVILALFKDMMCSKFNIIHLIIFSHRFVKFQSRGNVLKD